MSVVYDYVQMAQETARNALILKLDRAISTKTFTISFSDLTKTINFGPKKAKLNPL